MADFSLEALSLKELRQLQKDLAKAISTYEDRHKAEARAKLDAIAKEMGGVPVYLLSQLPVTVVKINNAVKRDFVEIDDRPVQVFNLFTGKVTTERFGDVPVDMSRLEAPPLPEGFKEN